MKKPGMHVLYGVRVERALGGSVMPSQGGSTVVSE